MKDGTWDRVADACADIIRSTVRLQPGNRWDVTGKLLNSLEADGASVAVAADRLQRPELKQLFLDECVKDPTDDRRFVSALDESVTAMLEEVLGDDRL